MARASKQGQQTLELKTWGGKRKGAGRPAQAKLPSEPHKRRERFTQPTALHVTLRVVDGVGKLRRRAIYQAVGRAVIAVLPRADFRIVHLSLETDHVHVICEADDDGALASGIKAFQSSAAQHINQVLSAERGDRRRGQVFRDRYHARRLTSPTQARHAIAYVLNNWRHHGHDTSAVTRRWAVDYFSSGPSFPGWIERTGSPFLDAVPPTYERLMVARPQTWLLAVGWARTGTISMRTVPGSH